MNISKRWSRRRRGSATAAGFTLVELLVVIAIIGVLIGLLLPAVQAAREAGRRSACQNKLRQLGLGLAGHESARGQLPNGADGYGWTSAATNASLLVKILPYIELEQLYAKYDFSLAVSASPNNTVANTLVPLFFCPSYTGTKQGGMAYITGCDLLRNMLRGRLRLACDRWPRTHECGPWEPARRVFHQQQHQGKRRHRRPQQHARYG